MKTALFYPLLLLTGSALFGLLQKSAAQEAQLAPPPRQQFDASTFPGSDICARTNAAVAATFAAMKQPEIGGMASLRGRVRIPAGDYVCKTAIHLLHGVWITGDGDATFLSWNGSGPAIIASDVNAPGEYVQGVLSDLHIRGTRLTGQDGIYVGGDATCNGTCTANPATNVGYNYVFRNVTVLNMGGNGIQYGNNAFNLLWDNVHSNNNSGYGLYVPHTSTGGGQYNTWTHSQLAGNALGGWLIDQLPFVTFEMFGLDVQYNGGDDGSSLHAEVNGGHVICVGCHFEHQQGVFFSLNSELQANRADDIQLVGGQLITVKSGVTDPYLVLADGAARFTSNGTYIVAFHNIQEMILVKQPSVASISVFGTSISSLGMHFGGITNATGQGIRYEQPIDIATQAPNVTGQRYFGGITNFDTVEAGTLHSRDGFSGTCATGVVVTEGIVTGCK
jgi:hypothetical protein